MNRLEYNYEILHKLTYLVSKFPDWRFTQLLSNIGLDKDLFYEEPDKTLERINNFYKSYNIDVL